MYIPSYFKVTDKKEIFAFIEANAFGQLISRSQGKLFSTHLPFLLSDDKTTLFAHLAKQNPQAVNIEEQELLVTLQGPHGYISPSWYANPGVPTWNYQAAHIYGDCKVFHDIKKLKVLVDALTNKYESNFSTQWQPEYDASLLIGIVGIEISITNIECKYKLSQNRPAQDQKQVIEHLRTNNSDWLAEEIQRNIVINDYS